MDPHVAELKGKEGKPVILARIETSPEDMHGILRSKGILTKRGGMTSHAAVVARGAGLPAVVGADDLGLDTYFGTLSCGNTMIRVGDTITIDGTNGNVFLGAVPTLPVKDSEELKTLLSWRTL